ncbi:iron complex transport system substrate-binding protein [Polynucleobacter meluiroseus]|uniref:Iron complex transport system substrate-binding protein n=1 Tax=Polynucleobacter meluiroseus TaxID=1938814 RepID=A0A240E0W0_9BURK|nr:ABC transporter substrate-binding protein [Polynucleobacter meluiroseus]SNX28141.1 iron complex transport system substrate-binding protein [Polynucleobacter meluiroseus]
MLHSFTVASSWALIPCAFADGRRPQAKGVMRLISIGGALTEIIYALQQEQYLLGVDSTSLYPRAATLLPNVGYARTLSAEGILALKPTQIIATEDAGPPLVLQQVKAAGIPIAILRANFQFQGVLDRVNHVGSLLKKESSSKQLVEKLHSEWKVAQNTIDQSATDKPRVMFILAQNPSQLLVSGINTSADAMIAYAGAQNSITQFSGYRPLTPEAVIAANPQIILLTNQGMRAVGGIAGVMQFPGLSRTDAGRHKKIISMEAMYLLGFGPRMPLAVVELHRHLHMSRTS